MMNEIKKIEKDGNICAIYEINGYRVNYSKLDWGITMSINSIDRQSYLPEIYFDENKFRIQTTSYGALESSEIDKVIEGYKTAQETVEELKKFFKI